MSDDPLEYILAVAIHKAEEVRSFMTGAREDWGSELRALGGDGQFHTGSLGSWHEDLDQKLAMAAKWIRTNGFIGLAMTYQVELETYDSRPADTSAIEEIEPDRTCELLVITVCDAQSSETRYSLIDRRNDRPPKLGPWETTEQMFGVANYSLESRVQESIIRPLMDAMGSYT